MINTVVVSGRLGKDPEIKYLDSGKVVAKATMAIDQWKKDAPAIWVDLTFWGKTAEFISNYAKKGAQLTIQGRLDQDEWNDKNTGQKRTKLYITVENVNLPKQSGNDGGGGGQSTQSSYQYTEEPNGAPMPF